MLLLCSLKCLCLLTCKSIIIIVFLIIIVISTLYILLGRYTVYYFASIFVISQKITISNKSDHVHSIIIAIDSIGIEMVWILSRPNIILLKHAKEQIT